MWRIHIVVGHIARIFVSQSEQEVSEFMNIDFVGAGGMMGRTDSVEIKNTSPSVFLCIGKYIDIIIGCMGRANVP